LTFVRHFPTICFHFRTFFFSRISHGQFVWISGLDVLVLGAGMAGLAAARAPGFSPWIDSGFMEIYPLVMTNIAMENGP